MTESNGNKTSVFGSSDTVSSEELQPIINEVLDAIGKPDVLVFDDTKLKVFGNLDDISEQTLISMVRSSFGITVHAEDTVLDIALRVKRSRQK